MNQRTDLFIHTRVLIIRKTNVGEDGGKEHSHTIAGRNIVDTRWKTIWEFFKILQMEFPSDPVIPLQNTHRRI